MKKLIVIVFSLAVLGACAIPADYEERDTYGGGSYNDNGYYRYDSQLRSSRYDRFHSTGIFRRNKTSSSYGRYGAYNRHGHSLHSSRYRNYHHNYRIHSDSSYRRQ